MKKSFGQHFLHDPRIISRIIDQVPDNIHIVEVGPGAGALTKFLYQKTTQLTLIEADRDLIVDLSEKYPRANIIHQDAVKVDYNNFSEDSFFISNLPYNSAAAILMKVLQSEHGPQELVIMVQKEQADRLLDKFPKKRSVLTIATQLYAETKFLFHVGSGAFSPPPKVDSSVVFLKKREVDLDSVEKAIGLAKLAFNERRKQLGSSLKGHPNLEQIESNLHDLGLSLKNRPADLQPNDWLSLIS